MRRRPDFLHVARRGVKRRAPAFTLQVAPTRLRSDRAHVGFTATKKLGGAVVRNRVKRRLRAAAAAVLPHEAHPGIAYVLIGRPHAAHQDFAGLVDDLRRAVQALHLTGRKNRASGSTRSEERS